MSSPSGQAVEGLRAGRLEQTGLLSLSAQEETGLLAAIFAYSPEGASYVTPSFVVRAANEAFARQVRRPLEAIVNRPMEEAVPGFASQLGEVFLRVGERAQPFTAEGYPFEFEGQPERGITYWDATVSPVLEPGGELRGYLFLMREVTERVRAAEERDRLLAELEAAHRDLQRIIDQLPDGVLVIDQHQRVTLDNAAIRLYVGRDLAGLTLLDLRQRFGFVNDRGVPFPPGQSPSERALRGETVMGVEVGVRLEDGRALVVLENAAPLREAGSRTAGAVVALTDITARRQAEAELERLLAESRRRASELDAVINSIADAVLMYGPKGEIARMNPAAEEILRYSEEERARPVEERLRAARLETPEGEPLALGELPPIRALHGETLRAVELRFHRPPDRVVYISLSAAPVHASNGALVGVVVTFTDVSERRRAQEALHENEERLRMLVANSPDHMFIQDRGLRYTWVVNPLPPLTVDNMLGKTDLELLPRREDGERLSAIKREVLETGAGTRVEVTLVLDGEERRFDASYQPRQDHQGRVTGLFGYVRDITARRRSELERERLLADLQVVNERLLNASMREQELAAEAQRRAEEAEAAVRARDEFLAGAAHELKTPVTNLRGYAQLTLRRIEKAGALDPAQVRQAMETIDQQSDRLARLVAQLLDVSAITAGDLELDREPTDLAALVRDAVVRAEADSRGRTFILRSPPAIRARVDPSRLGRVLANLLDNAAKFSPKGAPVEVEVSAPEPGTVRIVVRDHGPGIPPERRQRLFSPFYQAQTGRPFAGLGLGLYYTRAIVELHGGRVEAEFPPEGGTRFIVTLPRDRQESEGSDDTGR